MLLIDSCHRPRTDAQRDGCLPLCSQCKCRWGHEVGLVGFACATGTAQAPWVAPVCHLAAAPARPSSLSASSGLVASLLVGIPPHVRVVVWGQRIPSLARFVTTDWSIAIMIIVDMVLDAVTVRILVVAGVGGAVAVRVDGFIPTGEAALLWYELP